MTNKISDIRNKILHLASIKHTENDVSFTDVVFTGDKRIKNALELMLIRQGRTLDSPIGWQGYILMYISGSEYRQTSLDSEHFVKAFTDLGYKKGEAA